MAKQREWFGPGSIIIITTEDRKPLKQLKLGIDHIYKMKFPNITESLQIFCHYAFGQKSPDNGFERLTWQVTELAGNLPLGLKVMGSYLRGMSMDYWIEALPRLRSSLDGELESTLRLSYDGLTEKDKALFLHIACFFESSHVDYVKRRLENCGLEVNHGLQVLSDKSLISIENGYVKMHSLLKKMGREIVKIQSLEEPGRRQFLWDANEITDVLEESTGTSKVLGILLHAWRNRIQISKSAFDGMNNLQFLKVVSLTSSCIPEGLNCLPDKLRLIYWQPCPLRFWPSKFSTKFLVELIMPFSKFEKLWQGIKPLPYLKLMDLNGSVDLKEIPDLSEATSLEELDLSGCKSLLGITSSIGNATKLRVCNLKGCMLLKELPSSIGRLVNLEELDLIYCSSLKGFSGCSSLKELGLRGTAIEEVPSSMSTWSCLYKLDMCGCKNLKEFPNVPDSIVILMLSRTRIEEIPPWIEKLFRLRSLTMNECKKLKTISPNISKLENLEFLELTTGVCVYNKEKFTATIKWGPDLKHSWSLRSDFKVDYIFPICLPEKVLSSPRSLYFRSRGFKTIPDCIRSFPGLSALVVKNCGMLEALPQLPGSLQSIDAESCKSLKRIDSSFQNPNICLDFSGCYNLNQESRKLIQTSSCKYAFLPGRKVPAHFTHRASSGSLKINLTPRPLPSSIRFEACILLSYRRGLTDSISRLVACCVRGKQNGLTIEYISDNHPFPWGIYRNEDHLYIFEDSFCLNQDCPEAEEATFSELSFEFIVHGTSLQVKGCGVRLLEIPHCSLEGNEEEEEEEEEEEDDDDDDEEEEEGDEDESTDDGEGSRRRVFCFNYQRTKGKSETKRVSTKDSFWSRIFAVKRSSSSINQTMS